MTARDIEYRVAKFFGTADKICVPNLSHGMGFWEMDLAVLTASGYLYEIEIKVSVADLRRDKLKGRWKNPWDMNRFTEMVSQYYVAVPKPLIPKIDVDKDLQPFAGLLAVDLDDPYFYSAVTEVRPSSKSRGRALTTEERFKMARLGVFRYWSNHPSLRQTTEGAI